MQIMPFVVGAILTLTGSAYAMDMPFLNGQKIAPGDTVSTDRALASTRANASDRFDLPDGRTSKLFDLNGKPITSLRLVGQRDGKFFYAPANGAPSASRPPSPSSVSEATTALPAVARQTAPTREIHSSKPIITGTKANNGCVRRFTSSVRDITVSPAIAIGCYRAIETATGASVEGLIIRGLEGRDLFRDGIRLRGVRNVLIEDFKLLHMAEANSDKDLPEGIAIGGDGHSGGNLTIRNGVIRGFRMSTEIDPKTGKERYTNGDGIAIEGGIDGVLIEDVVIEDSTDGGVDTKSTNTRIDRVTVRNVNRAFRIWHDLNGGTLTAENFAGAAIWAGKGAQVHVRKLIARTAKPGIVFRLESNARIVVDDCDLTGMATGSTLTKADGDGASVKLGASCKLP